MRRLTRFAATLPILLIGACSGTKALYDRADTPPQYAKAVLIHHNAIGEQVADLRADSAVSTDTKAKLLEGYRLTVCSKHERDSEVQTANCAAGPAQRLEAAGRAVEALANAQTEAELQKAVDDLVDVLVPLIDTISEAK